MANETNTHIELKALVESAQAALAALRQKLAELNGEEVVADYTKSASVSIARPAVDAMTIQGKVVEGVFDGQHMIAADSKQYSVPANYASRSKLVEGDSLKLTIADDGSFIYKQIGPVDRERMVGSLTKDEVTGEYRVLANERSYKVLLASITYFKGEPGDEVVVLVPTGGKSTWAAVENIIKQG